MKSPLSLKAEDLGMVNLADLRRFSAYANAAGYASGSRSDTIREVDGSVSIRVAQEGWRFHDNHFGGEPFGGRAIIFRDGRPVFLLTYYGWATGSVVGPPELYGFLREALRRPPADMPVRGPKRFRRGPFEYRNRWSGDIACFSGQETILTRRRTAYRGRYAGGLVALRND